MHRKHGKTALRRTPGRAKTADLSAAFLDLRGRKALVVGGGNVAARKVTALGGTGARICVVAPEVSPSLARAAAKDGVIIEKREYRRSDLRGAWLVVAATDSREVNRAVARDAREARVFCNVVDSPALCSFQVPSVVKRGLLQVAVSTGGASPALARDLRVQLERQFGSQYARLLEAALELRRHVQQKYPGDAARRRRLMEKFVSSRAATLLLAGRQMKAFRRELEQWKSL